jgi:hypothetical protein
LAFRERPVPQGGTDAAKIPPAAAAPPEAWGRGSPIPASPAGQARLRRERRPLSGGGGCPRSPPAALPPIATRLPRGNDGPLSEAGYPRWHVTTGCSTSTSRFRRGRDPPGRAYGPVGPSTGSTSTAAYEGRRLAALTTFTTPRARHDEIWIAFTEDIVRGWVTRRRGCQVVRGRHGARWEDRRTSPSTALPVLADCAARPRDRPHLERPARDLEDFAATALDVDVAVAPRPTAARSPTVPSSRRRSPRWGRAAQAAMMGDSGDDIEGARARSACAIPSTRRPQPPQAGQIPGLAVLPAALGLPPE